MNDGRSGLKKIYNNSELYKMLMNLLYIKKKLQPDEAEFLYAVALSLIDEYEKNRNQQLYLDYAYYIIAKTSFKIEDFRPLYDFTVNYGYYPIARKIEQLNLLPDITLNQVLASMSLDDFSVGNRTLTFEQKKVFQEILDDQSAFSSFLAPTSYGKSELIFEHIKKYDSDVVGIIVPTKALIDQLHREAKVKIKNRKIIVHDQNYKITDNKILAIVTQERALRLMEAGIVFDYLYIDEAHEILDFHYGKKQNNRSLLLVRLLNLVKIKNENCKFLFLSPVLNNASSLRLKNTVSVQEHKIYNDLKLWDIQYLGKLKKDDDIQTKIYQYDRYLGTFFQLGDPVSPFEYIRHNSKNKNLHFLFRPKYIEDYAQELFNSLESVEVSPDIQNLIIELKELVHEDFKMVKYLEKGIIYLHAKLPNIIKNYLLKFVRESPSIKHFVANSVVLAGINLPIDNLFYISGFGNMRDLRNLIGRVNRLNEIFSLNNNDLSKIFIPVRFIYIDEFPQNKEKESRLGLQHKIEKLRQPLKDDIKNPLLANANIKDENQEKAKSIKDKESQIIQSFDDPSFEQKLSIAGAQQILNYNEKGVLKLEARINQLKVNLVANDILELIKTTFFDGFTEGEAYEPEYNAKRLRYNETILYYQMFIDDLKELTLRERINNVVNHWKKQGEEYKIYIGSTFGEIEYDSLNNFKRQGKVYVKLAAHKDDAEYLHNLAILKLQIDEEFLGHEISLLINTLLKFELVEQEDVDQFYYGTSNQSELSILQLGISRPIFNQLKKDGQLQNIVLDEYGNTRPNSELLKYIGKQVGIQKFELEQYFI